MQHMESFLALNKCIGEKNKETNKWHLVLLDSPAESLPRSKG